MGKRNNSLLLFAKLPEAGKVKTRLSWIKDGAFSPEDACELFKAMLLDVCDVCLKAFDKLEEGSAGERDSYTLYISTAPASNSTPMSELLESEGFPVDDIRFIGDSGATFDEHYNDAFSQVWEDGADCILSMGADMPALTVWDIVRGFEMLHRIDEGKMGDSGECSDDKLCNQGCGTGIVLAPDQEMGVSIVGWTKQTHFDHTGVFYNPTGLTVLPAYIEKAKEAFIPAIYLPPVPDVDTMADLAHNITLIEALCYCSAFDGGTVPTRTAKVLEDLGCAEVRVPPNELRDAREEIDI